MFWLNWTVSTADIGEFSNVAHNQKRPELYAYIATGKRRFGQTPRFPSGYAYSYGAFVMGDVRKPARILCVPSNLIDRSGLGDPAVWRNGLSCFCLFVCFYYT
jgi:hypothetical protein